MLSSQANLLTSIRLLTQPPCKCALTCRGSRVYPNDRGSRVYPNRWGSQVYPNSRGSRVYPNGWGSRVYPNGRGSWARSGRGRRCARASPSRLALRARSMGFALAVCAMRPRFGLRPDNIYMNSFITIKWIHLFCTAKNLWTQIS